MSKNVLVGIPKSTVFVINANHLARSAVQQLINALIVTALKIENTYFSSSATLRSKMDQRVIPTTSSANRVKFLPVSSAISTRCRFARNVTLAINC